MADDSLWWESNKIEIDVKNEQVLETRQKINLVLKRRVKDFGSPVMFSDLNATDKHGSTNFAPYEDKAFNIQLMQLNKGCQVLKTIKEKSCQTDVPLMRNVWIQSTPREMSQEDCNRIIQSETFSKFIDSVTPRLNYALEEIEIVDIFNDEFEHFKRFAQKPNEYGLM